MAPWKRTAGLAVILILTLLLDSCASVKKYQYKQYTYRKKHDDKRFRLAQQRCEMEAECHSLWGTAYIKCIRRCISQFCYKELYTEDELEDGEIDVRLDSFKGCLNQEKMGDFL